MIVSYEITSTEWTAITTAGQDGTCWLDAEGDGEEGAVDVRLYHSKDGVPSDDKVSEAYPVFRPNGNSDVLPFTADDSEDIYYARCITLGSKAMLIVDAN